MCFFLSRLPCRDLGQAGDIEQRQLLPPNPHVVSETSKPVEVPQHIEKKVHHRISGPAAVTLGATVAPTTATLAPGTKVQPEGALQDVNGATSIRGGGISPAPHGEHGGSSEASSASPNASADREIELEEKQAVEEDIQSTPTITFKEYKR